MGEGKSLLPWKSRPKAVLDGLQGICIVHHHSSNGSDSSNGGNSNSSRTWSQVAGFEDSQKLLLQTEGSQSFQLWNVFPMRRLWEQRPAWLRMSVPHCHGDRHIVERVANVMTSVPFILIGIQAPRKSLSAKMYANSVVGVGLASGFYHSSKGEARQLFRWGDYAMIAASTLLLTRALRKDDSKMLHVASAVCLPFQPVLVSALHVGLMQMTFAQRAQMEPHLRKAFALHATSSLVGCGLFVADDVFPDTPFLHAAWHIAAAVGVATCTKLLE